MLNEILVRVNHAFPIVRDCLEAIGASKCEVMSVLDLRDAYHTLPLAEESQKYCGLTPYYGSPNYVYLRMGMGMSCSPALWQQFVHIIWEQLPNKERYKIIMDDILIFFHATTTLGGLGKSFPCSNQIWFENFAAQVPIISRQAGLYGMRIPH